MARLVILTEGMTGRALELGANRVTIGRDEDNTFQIFQSSISTRHCEVYLCGKDYVVKDLGSTNGTYIAGAKITEGVLKPGQHLRLGDVELKLETDATTGTPAKQAGFKVRISRGVANKILWAGAGVAAFILIAFVAMWLISYLQKMPGEIGWWKLDDGSGNVAKDSSRLNGNNGKLVNGPEWVKGRRGGALKFSGNQYVSLGNIFQGSYKEISIACWIKHPRSSWQDVVERSIWDNPDGIALDMDYNGTSVSFGHYGTVNFVQSHANVQDDRWHYVVGTMHQSGSRYIYCIYVDGKLDNTAIGSAGIEATSNGWSIGARYDGNWSYQGLIDDVRIFDRALTSHEVQKLYNQ
jgi:hypothetical protein